MTFAGNGSREMGRKFFRSLGSAFGFLRRALISACFQLSGNLAILKEKLMAFRRCGAMAASALLKMWCGQGSDGDPEWMEFMVLRASSPLMLVQEVSRLERVEFVVKVQVPEEDVVRGGKCVGAGQVGDGVAEGCPGGLQMSVPLSVVFGSVRIWK
ncbi:hypothetical protein NDU88_002688 [Pleurodeles waltl]|uniref:Uncharacterized protein n=1 Tax=Pleurodeles waltl TaxID=8319 RepID=A0AAV7MR99_PLEWA|nr:hypothetical protein NDU88_002688 [Pleurodeles waltl]